MRSVALSVLVFGILFLLDVVDSRREKIYKNCRYDKEVKWSEPGNYLNCSEEPQNIRDNKFDCCEKGNGGIYCCDPDDKFQGDPNLIWAGIGVLGSLLIIFTFVHNWCNTQTFPWLKKYEKQINAQKKFWNSVADCTCCKVDQDGSKSYESSIRQVGVIYEEEHPVAYFGKGDGARLKFHNNNKGYQC